MTDAQWIDALAFQLTRALDKLDEVVADREELRVKLALRTKQLHLADELLTLLDDQEALGA